MAKKKKGVPSSDIAYATDVTNLKYAPELTNVRDLFSQLKQQYADDRNAARQNARSTISAVAQATPDVARTYQAAHQTTRSAQSDVASAFDKLGSAADIFRAATAREQGGALTRIGEAKTRAQQELTNRKLGAVAGRQLALGQAKQAYGRGYQTLSTRLQDILGQRGTEVGIQLGNLRHERLDRSATKAAGRAKADAETARTDAAKAKANEKKQGQKRAHIEKVRTATGDFQKRILDARDEWRRLAAETTPKTYPADVPDPKDATKIIHRAGDDIPGTARHRTEEETRAAMADAGYTPNEVHIALLVGNKPLDSRALDYMKTLKAKGVRIPRAWLTAPPSGLARGTGNPASSVGTGLG